jgi:dTDP-4-amino-4,6-dideoxygalactose transaminase
VELGYNYRIDEIRSTLGIVQLEKLRKNNKARYKFAQIYRERLAKIQGLQVPFENNRRDIPSYHIFPILLEKGVDRQKFMEYLKKKEIQTSIHYPPIHLFDFYRRTYNSQTISLPVTEDVAEREVTLPLYPSMRDEGVHYVCDNIVKFLQGGGS